MPRFFTAVADTQRIDITGPDAVHIGKALRMRPGEELTVCDGHGTDYACIIEELDGARVGLRVIGTTPTLSEPTLAVTLYQGLPKGDKMEWIVQKAVELGVTAVVPVATRRSVVRLDGKEEKKRERWQRIAAEAAGQSGRGILPRVETPLRLEEAMTRLAGETAVVFYEGGGEPLGTLIRPDARSLSIVIGPEGGFDPEEIEALAQAGVRVATLGPRILRCETAPLAALSVVMALTGNLE